MKRTLSAAACLLLMAGLASAQSTFYYPQIADGTYPGGFWRTTIFLTNASAAGTPTASGTVTFTQSSGLAFPVLFADEAGTASAAGTFSFQIAPGQTKKFTSRAAAPLAVGFATVTSTQSLVGTAVFSNIASTGRVISEAGVPSALAVPRQAIIVDTQDGFRTAVAYANPGTAASTATLRLMNVSGVEVLMTTRQLLANRHTAAFVDEIFPGAPAMAGTMQINSTTNLAAVALRFDPTSTVFSTLPAFSIASLINPLVRWAQAHEWLAPHSPFGVLFGKLGIRQI